MKTLKIIHTAVLVILGAVSVFMTFSVSFDWFGIREMEENYVPFILYTNMGCGFIYLFAAYMNWKQIQWSSLSLLLATIVLIIAFILLGVYISSGGVYELKTVKAMTFRTVLTGVLTVVAIYLKKFYPDNSAPRQ